MAKKKSNSTRFSLTDILKGKFLIGDGSLKNWMFVFFLVALAFISITSSHLVDQKALAIKDLKIAVGELKAKYTDQHNELMQMQLEKNIVRLLVNDSLKTPNRQPIKLKNNQP